MINVTHKRILKLAVKAGEIMMKSGAEIHRVEDTIVRICNACHIPHVEVFATPTGIFVSLDSGDDESDVLSHINRLHGSKIDLKKISDINEFSRVFTTTDLSIEEGLEELSRIEKQKPYPYPLRLFGATLVSAFFCFIFTGSIQSSICAAFVSLASFSLSAFLGRYDINYFIKGFCCCALATILAKLISILGIDHNVSAIVIGSMMLFVPGAAITNSIRDFLSGDMLSGLARMSEAFIIAISLATGAGIVIKTWSIVGFTGEVAPGYTSVLLSALLSFFPTVGFSLLFHVPKRIILFSSLIGASGWTIFQLATASHLGSITACFLGACSVGLLSELCARGLKEATTIFTIPGIMPLVPGSGMYSTMLEFISREYFQAAATGAQTLFLAGAIALGLLIVGSIFKIIISIRRKILMV